jgi:hypothetical protein
MSLFNWIGDLFGGATKLVDELRVDEEEKGKLRNELAKIQSQMHEKSVELMKAESASDHFIVAAWRPICSLTIIALIVSDAYGWAKAPAQIYDLAEVFLGVYGGSRGLEKIVSKVVK